MERLFFYAPNVHVGGGFVLLKSLLECLPDDANAIFWLDSRAMASLPVKANWKVFWVKNSARDRIKAELQVSKFACNDDKVFCFHGLPPIFPVKAEVDVFQQNRIYLGGTPLKQFAVKTRCRLLVEIPLSKLLKERVSTYWVQTPSMRNAVFTWNKSADINVKVMPFADKLPVITRSDNQLWDFVYVADGEAHKNHRTLIEAWKHLAKAGFNPSLAITLSTRDLQLKSWIEEQVKEFGLNVTDLGQMPHSDVLALYASSGALIFPSKSESFGLPLIEAASAGLPILAGELDFIRDVCTPVQTFDPTSAVSIYRAVRRYLSADEQPLAPATASDFLEQLLSN